MERFYQIKNECNIKGSNIGRKEGRRKRLDGRILKNKRVRRWGQRERRAIVGKKEGREEHWRREREINKNRMRRRERWGKEGRKGWMKREGVGTSPQQRRRREGKKEKESENKYYQYY